MTIAYPLFMPPLELAEKGAKNWKKKEAQSYLNWFLNVRVERVSHFLSFLDYQLTGENDTDLAIISKLVFSKINTPNFYSLREIDGAKQLNNEGLALASDMGLLLSTLLQKEKPSLSWRVGIGPKSYHSYNLPVLGPFEGNSNEVDLIFLSIVNTGYSINVLHNSYDWAGFLKSLVTKAI